MTFWKAMGLACMCVILITVGVLASVEPAANTATVTDLEGIIWKAETLDAPCPYTHCGGVGHATVERVKVHPTLYDRVEHSGYLHIYRCPAGHLFTVPNGEQP